MKRIYVGQYVSPAGNHDDILEVARRRDGSFAVVARTPSGWSGIPDTSRWLNEEFDTADEAIADAREWLAACESWHTTDHGDDVVDHPLCPYTTPQWKLR